MNTIFENINDDHEVVKNQIFKKIYVSFKLTWRYRFFLFHLHNPKPKQNHEISSSRDKINTKSDMCGV